VSAKDDEREWKASKTCDDTVVVDVPVDRKNGDAEDDSEGVIISEKVDDEINVSPSIPILPSATIESLEIKLSPKTDTNATISEIRNVNSVNTNDESGKTSKAIACKVPRDKGPRKAMSNTAVAKDESKLKKIAIRVLSGFSMGAVAISFLLAGHIYICALIFFVEVLLFRELVGVRYNTFFHIVEETIPLFRTTQWLWFFTSMFYTLYDFVVEVIKSNSSLHYLLDYAKLVPYFAFVLYSGTFVTTITTMQKGHIRFQVNQLCWTILVLCLTVGQLKYIMHNVFNGLIWFTLPVLAVICNDTFAWLAGITCGRKFIQRDFVPLSPNKTWEGFIGGFIGTMVAGWYLSYFLAQYSWMTCPVNNFNLSPGPLECEPNPIFHKATNIVPPQIFELFPRNLVRMIPKIVNICTIAGDPQLLAACVSGDDEMQHHHFELVLSVYPVQIHALALSLFAGVIAPFGGFLASAIKRAYAIKDFDSIIPGHGGIMDRLDCQLLMALYTWVHYNTFVSMSSVSVPKALYMFNLLSEDEQADFLNKITNLSCKGNAKMLV